MSLENVNANFKSSYEDINDRFKKYFQSDCHNEIIYHYTDSFLEIITSQEIRISNLNYFDDRLEYDYGIRFTIKILKELSKKNNYENEFFSFIEQQILKFYINRHHYYIFSTCLQKNNVHLYDNYSKKKHCSMGLNKEWFINIYNGGYIDNCNKNISYTLEYGKVIYDKKEQDHIISEYIIGLYKTWQELQKSEIHIGSLAINLSDYLLMFKTEDYKKENEFRLVYKTIGQRDFIYDDSQKYFNLKFTGGKILHNPIENIIFAKQNNEKKNLNEICKLYRVLNKLGYKETKIDTIYI